MEELVSFIIVSYNQEHFIKEAMRSALSQDYSNLEIILSDDCSTDNTFDYIVDEAKSYHGPHKVILNRNQNNIGLAANLNKAFSISSGSIFVLQGGDDVSLPERTSRVVAATNMPNKVDMVCSNVFVIDENGDHINDFSPKYIVHPVDLTEVVKKGSISALGCACAYSSELFDKFGPIKSGVLQEDCVLPFRALLGKGIRVVDEPLVKYRIHGHNVFVRKKGSRVIERTREESRRWAYSWLSIAEEWIDAWRISGRQDSLLERKLEQTCLQRKYDVLCYEKSRAFAFFVALVALCKGLTLRNAAGILRRHILRW